MLLQPHSSPRSRGGLRASGREEVTLTNKQGGGWCAQRQGVEGVPGDFSRDLWPRRCGAISAAFGSCLLTVWSPGCYAGVGCSWGLQEKTSPVHRSCNTTSSQAACALPRSLARNSLGVLMGPVFSPL